jgi:hypothetical protein
MRSFLLVDISSTQSHIRPTKDLRVTNDRQWYRVTSADNNIFVQLRYRQAYPRTYCYQTAAGDVVFGYGAKSPSIGDEYLHVLLTKEGELTIRRDIQCTLPLFCGYDADRHFVLSNEYHEVVRRLRHLTLDEGGVSRILCNDSARFSTPWRDIQVLGERQVARLHRAGFKKETPPRRPWIYNSELAPTNPRDFPAHLEHHMDRFIQTRLIGSRFGFEISGGLDSSFLPLYLRKRAYKGPLFGGSLVLADPSSQGQQLRKINDLADAARLESWRVFLDPSRDFPLANHFKRDPVLPFHIVHELYEPGFAQIAEHFRELGLDVVVTGSGSDQLFEHRPHPSVLVKPAYTLRPPRFATDKVQVDPSATDPARHTPTLLSETSVQENIAHANIYIAHDLWPVTPFNNVELFNFCQALPLQFRESKNIFRAYFQASHFPRSLYAMGNEDFSPFFEASMLGDYYTTLIGHLLEEAVSEKLGFVTTSTIRDRYTQLRQRYVDAAEDDLFDIYQWVCLELNLRLGKQHLTHRAISR